MSAGHIHAPRALRLWTMLGVAGVALAASGCINENLLDPMADRQPRATRYKESPFYANGLSMQPPPEGTVPRERITGNLPLTTGRLPDGPVQQNGEPKPNYVTAIPVPVTKELLALGRKRFDITCGTCHGPLADGNSIVASQMALHPPPSLITANYVAKPSGYFFEVATKGFGMMASYAAELDVNERWAVVAYLRALQLAQTSSVGDVPADKRGELEAPVRAPQAPEGQKEGEKEHP